MTKSSVNIPNIIEEVFSTPWLITEQGLKNITTILERKTSGEHLSAEEMDMVIQMRDRNDNTFELPTEPSIGVLPIKGSLFPRANLFSSMSGGASVEQLRSNFKAMLESDMVTSILLDFNTPGGKADMIAEFANDIFNARGKKPIIASVNSMSASAGYYLASQADEIYATDSGVIGSIGVIAVHQEKSKQEEKAGITTTVFTSGEYKGIGNPHEPLTESDKFHLQSQLDETYTEFIDAVARGRGVDATLVLENYGKGLVYKSKKALSRGMIDGIETYDTTLARMTSTATTNHGAIMIGDKVRSGAIHNEKRSKMLEGLSAEVLEALGLTAESTSEELNSAILELNTQLAPLDALKDAVTKQTEFATMFPEQAAKMVELETAKLSQDAELFSQSYAKFSRKESDAEFGFTALALENIAEMHLAISTGVVSHEQFKNVLDLVATDDAIVQYGEIGTKRVANDVDTSDNKAVGTAFAEKVSAICQRDGIGWDEAVTKASTENVELATAYYASFGSKR